MWLDVIALILFAVFIVVGLLRGALATAMGLVALGAAYTAAIVAAPRLGPMAGKPPPPRPNAAACPPAARSCDRGTAG